MDNLLQWAQLKMVFRLLKDSTRIDKEALAYADNALDSIFNAMLRDVVPKVGKRQKTLLEMAATDFSPEVAKDPLLNLFMETDYIYHITSPTIEEKEHSIGDLLYAPPTSNRFTLVGIIGKDPTSGENQLWAIIDSNPVTELQVVVPDFVAFWNNAEGMPPPCASFGVYRIWCFQCHEFFTYEMNATQQPDNISCTKCNETIIERRKERPKSLTLQQSPKLPPSQGT
jgi:hypothetical protein